MASLRIAVLNAQGLRNTGALKVCVDVLNNAGDIKGSLETRAVRSGNPAWDHEMEFPGYSNEDFIRFTLVDEDLQGAPVAGARVHSMDFASGYEGSLNLQSGQSGTNVRLNVKVTPSMLGSLPGAPISQISFGATPIATSLHRPPEPDPDIPIGSIGSISSVSPLSMGSQLISGGFPSVQSASIYEQQLPSAMAVQAELGSRPATTQFGSYEMPQSTSARSYPIGSQSSIPVGSYHAVNQSGAYIAGSMTTPPRAGNSYPVNGLAGQALPGSYPVGSIEVGSYKAIDSSPQGSLPESYPVIREDEMRPIGTDTSTLRAFQSSPHHDPRSRVDYGSTVSSLGTINQPRSDVFTAEAGARQTNASSSSIPAPRPLDTAPGTSMAGGQFRSMEIGSYPAIQQSTDWRNMSGGARSAFPGSRPDAANVTSIPSGQFPSMEISSYRQPGVVSSQPPSRPIDPSSVTSIPIGGASVPFQSTSIGSVEVDDGSFAVLDDASFDTRDAQHPFHTDQSQPPDVMFTQPADDDSRPMQPPDIMFAKPPEAPVVSKVVVVVVGATGLLALTEGSRSECLVQVVDRQDNVVLQTPPVLDLDNIIWNYEQEVIRDGPLFFRVCDQEQMLGEAVFYENENVQSPGREVNLPLEKNGQVTEAQLTVQFIPVEASIPGPSKFIAITVAKADLSNMETDLGLSRNPAFFIEAATADQTSRFRTPSALSSTARSPTPVWNYKSEMQNYSGSPIIFNLHADSSSDVLGRACLRHDQFHPFGFEGDVTISDPKAGGGILGLLRVQVAINGKDLPQPATDKCSIAQASVQRTPFARSPLQQDFAPNLVGGRAVDLAPRVVSPLQQDFAPNLVGGRAVDLAPRVVTPTVGATSGTVLTTYADTYVSNTQYTRLRAPSATLGVDTNFDGRPNFFVTGADRNLNGIPDVLERTAASSVTTLGQCLTPMAPFSAGLTNLGVTNTISPSATVGIDTNFDGRPNIMVTGPDRNINGIPDFLEGGVVGRSPMQVRPATGWSQLADAPVKPGPRASDVYAAMVRGAKMATSSPPVGAYRLLDGAITSAYRVPEQTFMPQQIIQR